MKATSSSSKSAKINKVLKKPTTHLKKRIELYTSMIDQVKLVDNKLLTEVFKRLPVFIDPTSLKPDLISLLQKINNEHGFAVIEKNIVLHLSTPQLEQLKDTLPEVKEILALRQAERDRRREILMEDKKRLDVEPARGAGGINKRRKSTARSRSSNHDIKLKCEFCGLYDSNFCEEDMKDLHYLES